MPEELDQILILYKQPDFKNKLSELRKKMIGPAQLARYDGDDYTEVARILRDVAERGDAAVAQYTEKYDGTKLRAEQFRVGAEELKKAHRQLDRDLLASLRGAVENVRRYQAGIFAARSLKLSEGTGIRYTPIKRVGVCVPGAAAPLPSTVIMTVVPAQVAQVKEIAIVSPPRHEGTVHPVILAVCHELGVNEVYRIGGAQAVAALACGTQSIRKVDMIVGPGNKWVQWAKKNVACDYVGIDSVAGPSEILIIANEQADPAWVAADMLSQAEHAADSSAIVLTHSERLARQIITELKEQLRQSSRSAQAEGSLMSHSLICVVEGIDEAIRTADDFAPEHLQIQCGDKSRQLADRITNAGAIFIGPYTPVAVGDYWAGPSHTLPTGTRAKFSSALTSNDFVKSISIVEYSKEQLARSAEDIIRLAEVEGLHAHAESVRIRQQD